MTSQAALISAITRYLRDDADLTGVSGGVFYKRSIERISRAFVTWHVTDESDDDTFGGLALGEFQIAVFANWRDSDGQSYGHAEAINSRTQFLLDGKGNAKAERVRAALTPYFANSGWSFGCCRRTRGLTPAEVPEGADADTLIWKAGHLFSVRLNPIS